MVRFLALATVAVAFPAVADEARPPVALEAELVKSTGPGGRFGPGLRVRLVGGAKEVAVATDGFRVTVERGGKRVTVTFDLAEGKDSRGRAVIPSADALGTVRLQAGEVAIVRVPSFASPTRPATDEFQQAITDAVVGDVTLVVQYRVSDLLGKRYGLTTGRLTATASVAK